MGVDEKRRVFYQTECECGNLKEVAGPNLVSGNTQSCGCLLKEAIVGNNFNKRVSDREALLTYTFNSFRSSANRREIPFNLTKEQVESFIYQPCHYCGTVGGNTFKKSVHELSYNGLDRLDSHKDYSLENCVACCKHCNTMKNEYSIEDFFKQIQLIITHSFPKETIKVEKIDERYRKQVESFVKKHLRRASLQWKPRNEAIKNARVDRGLYKCAECGKSVGPKQYHLDHHQPVQPIGYEIDLMTWIYRLLCPTENFHVLCIACHEVKTQHENLLRDVRKLLKPKKNKK